MREPGAGDQGAAPWSVPVALADISEAGEHFDLAADGEVRARVARIAGLRELPRFEAHFDVAPKSGGLHVAGRVSATVGQTCVVTLELLNNEIEELVDLLFAPRAAEAQVDDKAAKDEPRELPWNEPEPLIDGRVDLGAIATEFLVLGLDPYPRKPGAVFQPPQDAVPQEGPFAALAGLRKNRDAG